VTILIERRYAPAAVRRAYDEILPAKEAIVVLQRIAHALHDQHLREAARHTLESTIIPKILEEMPSTRAASLDTSNLLRNIEERSQLLVERGINADGQPVMAFSHLTFQECLTSVDLKRNAMRDGLGSITTLLMRCYGQDRDWWEEVALLFGAQLDPSDQEAFFHRLYPSQARSH
jgi:predicted NACHT family NTPase